MKKYIRVISMCLALLLCLSLPCGVFAAEVNDATIDYEQKGSLVIYKIDLTNAEKDGVWDSSYVSSGVYDQNVYDALIGAIRDGDTDNSSDIGNDEQSFGYAIKGVEFTYLKVADIVQYSESVNDGREDEHVEILYAVDKVLGADFLKAIGLQEGDQRCINADYLDASKYFYQSDVLIKALSASMEANATTVKNALETYVKTNGGSAMPLTDSYGKTEVGDLELGLYLCVETAVPEMVVSTTNPFLISLPMTSVNGSNSTDGGTRWIYDVTTFPKNLTGIPSLEKTLREQHADTGKNGGSTTDITDGFSHTATASAGDIIDYQIISTLPSITSEATYLTCYSFIDTLSAGLTYNKNDLILEFFTDPTCTDRVAGWKQEDGFFAVTYGVTESGASTMTIQMTDLGLSEINCSKAVYSDASMVNSGYSDCTLRISYAASLDSDNSVVFGDEGNPNDVVLTWKRSSLSYYDTLVDDAHVFTYGIDLTKHFSDGLGNFDHVEFVVQNNTDGYYVVAQLDQDEGIYYVTDHTAEESEATHFIPVEADGADGKVIIKGLEDDTYTVTEVRTDDGYTLLRDDIEIVISQVECVDVCDIYESDVAGLIQNDPRYTEAIIQEAISNGFLKTDGKLEDILNNLPQKQLAHHKLTAAATVDGNEVNMLEDRGSVNAHAPLTVVNTSGFDLPATGDRGVWMYGMLGIMLMGASLLCIVICTKKRPSQQ